MTSYDAVVVGSGPNGLTAAATLAKAGWAVLVVEGADRIGGGLRSVELFESGTVHDSCAAVHPLGFLSPAWTELAVTDHGVDWLVPDVSFVHVFDAERAVAVYRSWDTTLRGLGPDASRWRRVLGSLSADPRRVADAVLTPARLPRDLITRARFGPRALPSIDLLTRAFSDDQTRAVFAAVAAHGIRPTSAPASAAAGLLLIAAASNTGWPIARGGSSTIAAALADVVTTHGGRIETGWTVRTVDELPSSTVTLFDTSPTALLSILGDRAPASYRRRLNRYAYGPGVCKIDYLLSEPIPWRSTSPGTAALAQSATFHLAPSYDAIASVERDVDAGRHPSRPWLLGGEPTRIDPSRSAGGRHVAWSYTHVPNGSDVDVGPAMTAEIERCAPGFSDVIVASRVTTAAALGRGNPNLVGGDIGCGASSLRQLLARPTPSLHPYSTPVPGVFLCSSATPPGGGAHGMCGYNAAQAVLRRHPDGRSAG